MGQPKLVGACHLGVPLLETHPCHLGHVMRCPRSSIERLHRGGLQATAPAELPVEPPDDISHSGDIPAPAELSVRLPDEGSCLSQCPSDNKRSEEPACTPQNRAQNSPAEHTGRQRGRGSRGSAVLGWAFSHDPTTRWVTVMAAAVTRTNSKVSTDVGL